MIYLFSAFSWLGGSIFLHIIINKFRDMLGISRFGALGVFIVGFVGSAITAVWLSGQVISGISLPWTSMALYVFCSLAYLTIAGAPILGDESPTTKILIGLRNHGPLTGKQLLSLCTYDEVIGQRIKGLYASRWIQKKGNTIVVTARGKRFAAFIAFYRKVLGLSEGG